MAIALNPKFPAPDRSDQTINRVKDEDGVIDVGWNEGVMSDGRPFRIEMWAHDGVSMLTAFFSAFDFADLNDEKIAALILAEAFVTFREGARQYIEKMLRDDPSGNLMWSASVVVGDEDLTSLAGPLPIFPHPSVGEASSIFRKAYTR